MSDDALTLFVTGNSSGLGHGLTEVALERGWEVFGLSRSGCDLDHPRLHDLRVDLTDREGLRPALEEFLADAGGLDLVVLNAGILGEIRPLVETPLEDLERVMDVNVWANKIIMDVLHARPHPVARVVMISSGAAVFGSKGWGAYALSKAALNMLARLYSHEFPDTIVTSLAPGLIDTRMQDYLCEVPDPEKFTAVQRLREARGTDRMPGPREAADRVLDVAMRLPPEASGEFLDIRQLLEPEEYEALIQARSPNIRLREG